MASDPVQATAEMHSFLAGLNLPADELAKASKLLANLATPVPNPGSSQLEIEAANRGYARTLHKILKPPTPSPYAGEIDADACHNFIDNQEEYYTIVRLEDSQWVEYTVLNLILDAKSW
jgi:hypothetical protein